MTADGPPEELPQDEVARLESVVASDPDAAAARFALLGHYSRALIRERGGGKSADRLIEHARWVVANHPGSKEARETAFICLPFSPTSRDVKEKFVGIWLRQIEAHPQDPDILFNAAMSLQGYDDDRALELFRRARKLAPERMELTSSISHILQRRTRGREGHKSSARERMRDIEAHLPPGPDGQSKVLPPELAEPLAMACFEAEEFYKAEQAARAMLHFAPSQGWNSGNLHFKGNMILGLVALHRGDLVAARDHLLASSETNGSPQLNSFGPNMSLAKRLLERGETETVVKFFERCGAFWDNPKLREWIAVAKSGIVPEFGANLVY